MVYCGPVTKPQWFPHLYRKCLNNTTKCGTVFYLQTKIQFIFSLPPLKRGQRAEQLVFWRTDHQDTLSAWTEVHCWKISVPWRTEGINVKPSAYIHWTKPFGKLAKTINWMHWGKSLLAGTTEAGTRRVQPQRCSHKRLLGKEILKYLFFQYLLP